jgi:hypothetical protein
MRVDQIIQVTCIECAMPFAVLKEFYAQRQRDYRAFYCPNGHAQAYTEAENKEVTALEKETGRLRSRITYLEDQLAATQAQLAGKRLEEA